MRARAPWMSEGWRGHALECHPVLGSQLLQLSHDTVRYCRNAWCTTTFQVRTENEEGPDGKNRRTLCEQAVHHALDELELVLERVVDEVGVYQDSVRRSECGVVREEETGRCCLTAETNSEGSIRSIGRQGGEDVWRSRKGCRRARRTRLASRPPSPPASS